MRAALIVAIVSHIAVLIVVLTRPPRVEHSTELRWTFIAAPAPPRTEPLATPTPAVPSPARPACPPPSRDAPSAASLDALPQEVHTVRASRTNAGWVAAWSDEHVFVSVDGGRTFTRVLDGDGPIRDVTFDCYGRALVVRGDELGIREGAREDWRDLSIMFRIDDIAPIVLVGGGPDIVVIGTTPRNDSWLARVGISANGGGKWRFHELAEYWESSEADGYQAADGTIHVALTTADCSFDPVFWYRIKGGKVETDELGHVNAIALYDDYAVARPRGVLSWKRFGDKSWRPITGAPDNAIPIPGPVPRAVTDDALYRIGRGDAARLRDHNPRHQVSTSDRAGRIWSIRETIDGESAWAVVD